MEESEFENTYKIDKKRLLEYFNRILKQNAGLSPIKNITKFLNNQSIGTSYDEVFNILKYYEDKIVDKQTLLDLAFEWIRAQTIRLEYKKYLIRAQYPNNDLSLAVDDCIYRFFLLYDEYIRRLFKKDIREYNISALYEIFFNPFDSKNLIIDDIIGKYIHNIPTFQMGAEKIDTSIITLRSGLSNIIVKDYEKVLLARKDTVPSPKQKAFKPVEPVKKIVGDFNGSNLERLIKTYCFSKNEIQPKALDGSIKNFLTSYLKFGNFYDYNEFEPILIHSLADYMLSGLTDNLKKTYPMDNLKSLISEKMTHFKNDITTFKLDGSAWVSDLEPVLKNFVINFIDNLFQ